MLPIKYIYIYIDSRHTSNDYESNTDFKIYLPVNISLPENTAFYITDISVPESWYTIESGRNNKLGLIHMQLMLSQFRMVIITRFH